MHNFIQDSKTTLRHVQVCIVLLRCLLHVESELKEAGRAFKQWN